MQVILMERVENLGQMGDVVTVKPGFARNYLLPQEKALRATKNNVAYFEAQRSQLEADNKKQRETAEKDAKKLDGLVVTILRNASEAGQMYGSVTSRDIAEAASEKSGMKITRQQVTLNQNFKTVGLFKVQVVLHPEVIVDITINIARSEDEAKIQEETGEALVVEEDAEISLEEKVAKVEAEVEEEAAAAENASDSETDTDADAETADIATEAEEEKEDAKAS